MSDSGVPAIALSIGDPNGIGPEIAVKAAAVLGREGRLHPVLVGDPAVIRACARRFASGYRLREAGWPDAPAAHTLDVVPVHALPEADYRPGEVSAAAGAATVEYLAAAVALTRAHPVHGIVACPHSETAVNAAGIAFSGYPGLLARLTGTAEEGVFLMLVGGGLRIVHATLHLALREALARLTPDRVEAAGVAAAGALQAMGLDSPRLAVLGINPHAGENGLFGSEDAEITSPAVARLRQRGITAEGPFGADTALAAAEFDAYIAMYHDQGHVPVKLLAGRTASALAVGAGVLFASVGHGTGFDIAGRGVADPAAVLRAARLLASGTAPAGRPGA